MKLNIKKLSMAICLVILCGFITSGCFLSDILSDMVKIPVVNGDWYNSETNTYITLKDDETFTMGYGKGNANSGGTYDYDKKEITLHLEYTMTADGKKENWDSSTSMGGKGKIVLPYAFNNDGEMIVKSKGGNLAYTKIGGELVDTTLNNLIGTWNYEKGGLSIDFENDKQYVMHDDSKTDGSEPSETSGSYTLDNQTLTLTTNGITRSFHCVFSTKDRLELSNDIGVFFYTRRTK